ncbi:hypothetical protein [Alphaproteobacteria bacterium endosymbiont of Tiliacea citrago]|uniref:hypothetical protein n=1 Tax=Alphaproteobacteria bacterium endosymbiont of Tiliacea citrago TaxID=3077944 RepID=UPI00313AD6D7
MSCIQLVCPKCYESYEIPEEILESFDKFKCNHCNFLEQKSYYSPKKIINEEETNDSLTSDFDNSLITKEKPPINIPVQNITLNNTDSFNSSNEVLKNIIIMVTALALLTGFVFLMIRK